MVDELELLRKDWQKQEQSLPHYSKAELYPMILKKSSSVVKWILIVSMLEFGFWVVVNFGIKFNSAKSSKIIEAIGPHTDLISAIIHLSALIFFMGWFYRNYRKIQNTDTAVVLMDNILNTRRTVKYYIWFNLIFFVIATIGAFILVEMNAPEIINRKNIFVAIAALIVVILFFVGLFLLFYRLLYGKLLKRLTSNYEELKKLEM